MKKNEAVRHFGSITNLAKALGVSKQAVSQWKVIPDGRQYQLEVITEGKLLAERKAVA